jgi:hypothetical protein
MKVNWLLETDIREDTFLDSMKKAIIELGHSYKELRYVPFQSGTYFDLFTQNDCVVTYGSIQLMNEIAKYNWNPGVYAKFDQQECSNYYPILKDFLLNDHYRFIPYGELKNKENEIFEEFGNNDFVFIRPSSGQKLFTGKVVERSNYNKEIEYFGFYDTPDDAICVVSEPKNIEDEWRLVSVDKKIVAASSYRLNKQKILKEGCPSEVMELAQKITNVWNPEPCWVIDVCRLQNGEFYLLEIGAFSCAGLYKCDPMSVIKAVSDQALRDK